MLKSIKLKILEQKANVVSTTVNFSTKHRAMLGNVRKWIDKGHVALDPYLFPELLTELRIATADEEMTLDKKEIPMDLLDSLRLAFEYIVY